MNIIDLIEKWARWRIYRVRNELGWPKRDSIGKLMSGVPSTKCHICKGEGRAPGWRVGSELRWVSPCPQCGGKGRVTMEERAVKVVVKKCEECEESGEINGKTHYKCRGTGKIIRTYLKANPAFIYSTRSRDSYYDDPTSQRIDYIVCTVLTNEENTVIFMEYTRVGDRNHKLTNLKREGLSMTHSQYNQMLIYAEGEIQDHLTL